MARIELTLPERFPFATELPVRIDDVNYGGHLGNDTVLTFVHGARLRFLAAHGWSEVDIEGVGLIMTDAAVVYRAEGRYGMVLRAEVAVGGLRSRGCDFLYRLTDVASGREIARARTGLLFYDYGAKKVASMPERFRQVIEGG